jgi:hydrogenase maturation protease
MTGRTHDILLLALGNEILGDDAAGLLACRELRKQFHDQIDIVETSIAGFALLDHLAGYEKVLILDSMVGSELSQGSVHELTVEAFRSQAFSSPHYVGLMDVIELAERLEIDFPKDIRILAIDVSDPYVLREGLTPEIESQLSHLVDEAEKILQTWSCEVINRKSY